LYSPCSVALLGDKSERLVKEHPGVVGWDGLAAVGAAGVALEDETLLEVVVVAAGGRKGKNAIRTMWIFAFVLRTDKRHSYSSC
jgi:hypothetical protein